MSDEKNFDKIFSEITSRENIGDMSDVIDSFSLNSARDYSLLLGELMRVIEEVNLIIINLTEDSDEPFEIPVEILTLLQALYSKARDFNNYMVNLGQDDIGYFIYIDDEEEDDNYDNDSE
jgi:hypothetical protein